LFTPSAGQRRCRQRAQHTAPASLRRSALPSAGAGRAHPCAGGTRAPSPSRPQPHDTQTAPAHKRETDIRGHSTQAPYHVCDGAREATLRFTLRDRVCSHIVPSVLQLAPPTEHHRVAGLDHAERSVEAHPRGVPADRGVPPSAYHVVLDQRGVPLVPRLEIDSAVSA
jgi:hypothetical protein